MNELLEAWVPGFVQGAAREELLQESWGDLLDIQDLLHAERSLLGGSFGSGTTQDRRDGRNIPIFQNDQDLAIIRANARLICDIIPTAQGALENLCNYTIGEGFTYRVVAEDGVEPDRKLLRKAQRVLDDFRDQCDWTGDLEAELFKRSRVDGEFFLGFWPQDGGLMEVRVIEPEQVRDPGKGAELGRCYTFGIDTSISDVCQVDGFWVEDSAGQFDYRDAPDIEHMKLGVVRNIKRGLSDFFSIRSHLEDSEKLNRNTRLGAAVAAAIAYIVEHAAGTTVGQAQTFQQSKATRTYARQTQNGSQTGYVRKIQPGTRLDIQAGMKYLPGPLATIKADVMASIEQSVLRKVGVRWCMPEYMVSGDASNANYSSSIVAESPFVRARQADQVRYKTRFARIHWRVLDHAANSGVFAEWGISTAEDLHQVLDLSIKAPSVITRNRLAEAQADDLEQAAGILSDSTRASNAGLDLEQEQKQGAKKAQPPAQPGMDQGTGLPVPQMGAAP